MKLGIIGDVHGKLLAYQNTILSHRLDYSIQLGDFGFESEWDFIEQSTFDSDKHKILMGNHDYYPKLNSSPFSLKNYSVFKYIDQSGNNMTLMTIRGAESIDKSLRTLGVDYFPDEQLSYLECRKIVEIYEKYKPHVVVTHEAPLVVIKAMFNYKNEYISTTQKFLDYLFTLHKPYLWYFGHHHKSDCDFINDTVFTCLNELELVTFDAANFKLVESG
jgi:Icc-related predicted phosphoesterase